MAIGDASWNAKVIECSTLKCRRVPHSSFTSKSMAFSAKFDAGIILKPDVQLIMKERVPLYIMTDCRCIFDIVPHNRYNAQRRLMIDMKAISQVYQRPEIEEIAQVTGASKSVYAMTKIVQNALLLG